jgi:hypothetical protein
MVTGARDRTTPSKRIARLCVATLLVAAVVAYAAGLPPIAVDDDIAAVRGRTVTRLANGGTSVLANDRDLERDTLTAILVENPRRGSLSLRPDGTFIYTHDGSGSDSDRFRYRASDGTGNSQIADVDIEISDPSVAPQIVGQRALSVPEDGALQIRLQDLVVQDPDSDYPQDFTLTITAGANFTVQGTTVRPVSNFNGTLSVPTRVNDGQTDSNVFNLAITVTPVNDRPIVAQPIGPREAVQGRRFELDARAAFNDSDAGDTLTFTATGLPASNSLVLNPTSGLLAGTPQAGDVRALPYSVSITARDAAGASVSTTFPLTIVAAKADVAITAQVNPNPATYDVAPTWTIGIENRGSTATANGTLRAAWFSSGPALTLSAPPTCTVTGNATAHVAVECSFGSVAAFGTTTVVAQTTQPSPGDALLIAELVAADSEPANDTAIANLNLAGSFSEPPAQLLDARSTSLAVGDLDGDGLPDIAAIGDEVKIFYNTAEKNFVAGPALGSASAGTAVAVIDWNSDGARDIAVLDRGTRFGRVFLNAGQSGFTQGVALAVNGIAAVTTVDVDGDGVAELIAAGDAGTMRIARNAAVTIVHNAPARHVAGADLNADGRADLVVTHRDSRAGYVLISTGTGFSASTLAGSSSTATATTHDIDADSDTDLLLAIDGEDFAPPANRIMSNAGTGSFADATAFGASLTQQLLAADVDKDGLIDIGVINHSGTHQFYRRTAQGALILQAEHILSPRAQHGALADLDGDTYPDLLLGGEGSPSIELYRNNGAGRFGRGDVTAPVITLHGAASMNVEFGDGFTDPGATAMDDVQGDLTAQIVVDNPVVPTIIGTYVVRYNVTDRAGNRAPQAERTVIVAPKTEGGGGGGIVGYSLLLLLVLAEATRRLRHRRT